MYIETTNEEIKNSDRIKVIDSPMGTGKTTKMIEYINEMPKDQRVIYITPFNNECKRIVKECEDRNFISPDVRIGKGSKSVHLLQLIKAEKNIVATHSLFSRISDEVIHLLRNSNYILVLDEAFNVVEKWDMWEDDKIFKSYAKDEKDDLTKETLKSLRAHNIISVEKDFKIVWKDLKYYQPKYLEFRNLCDRGLIYLINDELLLWTFPIECFQEGLFKEIYILTYLFDYQLQSYYYKYFDVPYVKYHMETIDGEYIIVKTTNNQYEIDWIRNIKSLVHIADGSINKTCIFFNTYGHIVPTALSKTWYNKNTKKISDIKKSMVTFFANYTNAKGSEKLWTCYKSHKRYFKDVNVTFRNFLSCNARATNDFRNKSALAYLINLYIDPFYIHFFHKKGIVLNKDGHALSEMLQWIWRSQIRDGKPIEIFIASERMRNLLINFLNESEIKPFANADEDLDTIENELD